MARPVGAIIVGACAAALGFLASIAGASAQLRLPPARAPCSLLSGRPCHPSFCGVFHRGPCFPEYWPPIGEDLRLTIVSTDDNDPAGKAGAINGEGGADHNAAGAPQAQGNSDQNATAAPKPEGSSDQNAAAAPKTEGSETAPAKPAANGDQENAAAANSAAGKDLDSISAMYAALRACWVPPPKDVARHGMQYTIRFAFKRDGEIIAPPRVTYASHDAPAEVRDTYRNAVNAALERCTPMHFSEGMGGAVAGRPIAIRFVDNRTIDAAKPQ